MDLSNITKFRLRRVNPFRGLVIDEATWAEAHDYHREHLRLHALAFHGAGIIAGLDVTPTRQQAGSVDVSAGVAINDDGEMIVIGQERHVPFDDVKPGYVFITVSYQENRVNADPKAARGAPANRIVESYTIDASNKPPEAPALELARVYWAEATSAVRSAADPVNPVQDEIDLRFRLQTTASRPTPVNIGVVADVGSYQGARGLTNLMREVDNVAGFHANFRGPINLDEGAGGSDLLYVCGPVESEVAVTTLASHLNRGGAVFADSCKTTVNGEKRQAIQALAGRLGLKLAPLGPSDPVLNMRYPFAEPPAGAGEGEVVGSGRFIASMRDYGCAWSGMCGNDVLPRETVRSALEWGVNVAISSVQPA
jgi:hypothetical protein